MKKSLTKHYKNGMHFIFIVFLFTFTSHEIIAGDIDEGEDSSEFFKPSAFELERMAPRTDLEMLSANLAGENISLADGGLSFSATDISIPLNMNVNATIARVYDRLSGVNDIEGSEFGDWKLDIPKITGTVVHGDTRWTPNYDSATACSFAVGPGDIKAALGQNVQQHEYWNGATLTIPGQGGGKLLSGNSLAKYQTTDNMKINCDTDASGNEFFIVETPTGLTYLFKQRRLVQGDYLIRKFKAATRKRLEYLATDIEDRFGNKLSYQYQGNGLLEYIKFTAVGKAEETLVTLNYLNDQVDNIVASGKTWRYEYSGNNLSKVIRPDNKFWLYEFPSFNRYAPQIKLTPSFDRAAESCSYEIYEGGSMMMKVTHPYGAVAEFDYALRVHGRTEVPSHWMMRVSQNDSSPLYNVNTCYANLAVTQKRLTVASGVTYQWNYNHTNNGQHWNIENWNPQGDWLGSTIYDEFNGNIAIFGDQKSSTCASNSQCSVIPTNLGYEPFDLRVLTVTEPANGYIKYYISKRWDHTDGKIVATQWFDSGNNLLKTQTNAFIQGASKGDSYIADPIHTTNLTPIRSKALKTSAVIIENGDTYTTLFNSYDSYGALLQWQSYNSFSSNAKHYQQAYFHDTTNWLLNLPTTKSISSNGSSWTQYLENTYYGETHGYKSLPYLKKTMGQTLLTNSEYHSSGQIKKRDFTGTASYEILEDYKRGKAQKITLPCSKYNNCSTVNGSTTNTVITKLVVNNDGSIDNVTDFAGNTTSYEYNNMGLLTKINPSDAKWTDTNIDYSVVAVANDNIAGSGATVGQLKQTITKGNYEKRTYFDSMLRPFLTRELDISDATTTKYQRNEYNHNNQTTFASFSSASVSATTGTQTVYDILNKQKTITRTSDNSIISYNYLSGNRIEVTSPYSAVTTTTYLAYGSPSASKPLTISSPENVTTTISYNLFGQIEDITQGGITEKHYYDENQMLCKTVRPDTGIVAFGYNTVRQLTWKAEAPSGSSTSCDTAVQSSEKINISYNNQNTLASETYPDNLANRSYEYDENGQLVNLTSGSGANAAVWTYDYDSAAHLNYEQLQFDGQTFRLDYQYSAMGTLNEVQYPSSRQVAVTSNALGQITTVGSYASNVMYHPNGQLKQLTYGNGVVRDVTLDTTGRIQTLKDAMGSVDIVSLNLGYSLKDNLTSLTNNVDASFNLSGFVYDKLDRLESVTGKFGAANFNYDNLGNITSKTVGADVFTYNNDATLNRLNSITGAANYSFSYDAVGNVTNNGAFSLTFNDANQVTQAKGENYLYDGHNRRVKIEKNGNVKYSMYSTSGQLFYQLDTSKNLATDHIYLGKQLIAKINNGLSMPLVNNPPESSDGTISLSWSAVSGATRYEIEEQLSANSWFSVYSDSTASWSKSEYINGDYTFRVNACDANGCSSFTDVTATVLLNTTTPSVPESISTPEGTNTTGSYTVSWAESTYATSYTLRESVNGGSWAILTSSEATTSQSFSNKADATYRYSVSACKNSDCSTYVESVTFTVSKPAPAPGTPSSISAPTGTNTTGSYNVYWAASSGATSYTLRQSFNGGSWSTVSTTTGTSKSFSGKGNGSYRYAIRACNSSGCSGYRYSSTFTVSIPVPVPSTPSTISAPTGTNTTGSYTVSWGSSSGATSYSLRQSFNGGSWSTVASQTSTSKAFSGKSNGTYRYGIAACNSSGCSGYKYSSTFTVAKPTVPSAPGSITTPQSTNTNGIFTISWSSSNYATSYTLRQSFNGGSWTAVSSSGTSASFSGKTSGTYKYSVNACNTLGCSSYRDSSTFTVLIKPSTPASINVPTGVDPDGAYTVSWSSSTRATSYTLRQSFNGGGWTTITSSSSATSKALSGKTNGTYKYSVAACNSSGCSGYREGSTFTVLSSPTSISSPSKDYDGTFTVSWGAVTNATSYLLQQKFGSTWATVYSGTSRSKTVSGLADGIYTYRVKACISSTCSTYLTGSNTTYVVHPTLSLSISPSVLINPGSTTFTWSAPGADYCSNQWIGSNGGESGSKTILVMGTTTEVITCYFGSQSVTASKKIIVKYGGGGGDL
ncbi:MAG: hypothetical protein HRT38_07590 [Alteromonadaceae bacterium]|nr:hypothetical protein [Alteromonadaceae bacterium]